MEQKIYKDTLENAPGWSIHSDGIRIRGKKVNLLVWMWYSYVDLKVFFCSDCFCWSAGPSAQLFHARVISLAKGSCAFERTNSVLEISQEETVPQ